MSKIALTIAGSDPSGGAGIQADLKVFHQYGIFGTAIISFLTAQNTSGVTAVQAISSSFLAAQLETLLSDITPSAGKLSAVASLDALECLAGKIVHFGFPLIADPIFSPSSGSTFLGAENASTYRKLILPHSFLITPNLMEAALLAEMEVSTIEEMRLAAKRLHLAGAKNVLVTGGHLNEHCHDVLWDGDNFYEFSAKKIDSSNTHGTGCTLSAAITAQIALGHSLDKAVKNAKFFVSHAIETAPGIGLGHGPLNFFAKPNS